MAIDLSRLRVQIWPIDRLGLPPCFETEED